MRLSLVCFGALVFVTGLAACSSDTPEVAPTCSSVSPLKATAEVGCSCDAQCQSGSCFIGGTQSFCTVKCTADNATQVCTTPLTGTCNKMGYCKRD